MFALLSYYVWWYFENTEIFFWQVFGIFDMCFSMASVWLAMILCISANMIMDMGEGWWKYDKNMVKYEEH